MEISGPEFDWDEGNREKCQTHGLSIREIESLFQSPLSVFPDPEHSSEKERFIGIGKTDEDRSVFIVFTLRRRDEGVLIRPISARYMHKKEIDHYEKEASKAEKRR
jgi:uncharacterized DUF497 family protein